ncbi:MAG: hypothetical protein Q8O30_03350 [Candidatus Omnitrophota bacterium]|nr:hypothetical protein [Candidatus Omnitrophota bacterium]
MNKITLILVSFLSLFLELCFIRWVPAHVFSVSFFTNVILISAFLGLGLGFLLTEKKWNLFDLFPWALIFAVLSVLFLRRIQITVPPDAKTWIWSYYQENRLYVPPFKVSIISVLGFIFSIGALVFIPVGQKIGKLMKEFSPLYAYSLNIFGSLLGVIFFGAMSFFNLPAFLWFLVAGLITSFIFYKKRGFFITIIIMISIVAVVGLAERDILWSPYYSIESRKTEQGSMSIYVNQFLHQRAINFEKEKYMAEKFLFPYKWFSPERVLIIGSGTGNDVLAARLAGVKHIDAVEIDPVILMLGREHPQRPYDSEAVRIFVDDARSFMHKASGRYDMIVFGTLDSQAMLSVTSSIRLDNYVYTRQALKEARELLTENGVMVLLFSAPTDWMKIKLLELARTVFGEDARYGISDNYLFNLIIFAGPGLGKALSDYPELSRMMPLLPEKSNIKVPSDDWPYLYLEKPCIPQMYKKTILMLLLISLAYIVILTPFKFGKINVFFLALGCGFLLLEAKSITTLSLLFGSTWIVNAVVFSAILFLALLANWFVMARQPARTGWFFIGLILSLIFAYLFPLASLLKLDFFTKILMAGFLTGLPIFFAATIFAIAFKNFKQAGIAIGSNLVGAVIGGFLEYLSMAWGLNSLYIVAIIGYLIAWICFIKKQV